MTALPALRPPDPLPVAVTAADIAAGLRFEGVGCPVALALRRAVETALPGAVVEVSVKDEWHVWLWSGEFVAFPPEGAEAWINAFDLGTQPVGPASFVVGGWEWLEEEDDDAA